MITARKEALRCSQRPASPAGGMNTPDDPSLCGTSTVPTPDPSGKPGEAHHASSPDEVWQGLNASCWGSDRDAVSLYVGRFSTTWSTTRLKNTCSPGPHTSAVERRAAGMMRRELSLRHARRIIAVTTREDSSRCRCSPRRTEQRSGTRSGATVGQWPCVMGARQHLQHAHARPRPARGLVCADLP